MSCLYERYRCNITLQSTVEIKSKVAKNYQWDRWINKTTAQHGFSVPDPPSNAKREYYARLEEEQKQRNKLAYQKRHGLSE